VYLVPFPIFDSADLTVKVGGAATAAFTVSATFIDGRSDDASITLTVPVTGVDVEIIGSRAPRSERDFVSNSPQLADQVQLENEKLTAVQQEQARDTVEALTAASAATSAGESAADSAAAAAASEAAAAASAAAADTFNPANFVGVADVGSAAAEGFTDDDDLAVDPGNVPSRGNVAAAIAASLPGSRVLLDAVDFGASPTLVGSGSSAYYEFPLFDPALYAGYEWEFVSLEANISGVLLEVLTTTDGGTSYNNSDAAVRTIVDDGSSGPSTSTTPYLHSGDNTAQSEFFSGSLKIMRPDIAGFTHGEHNIRRSNGAGTILVQSGYYLHGLAVAIDGIALRRVNSITAGFIYMYGIRRPAA
jgi:hypothetical protein